jgi:hypothetical protein
MSMNGTKEYDIHRYVTGTQIEAVLMPNAYHRPEAKNRQYTCKGSPPKSIEFIPESVPFFRIDALLFS